MHQTMQEAAVMPPRVPTAAELFPGRLTISPDEFAAVSGAGRTLIYEAIRRKEIPSKRLGTRILIPLAQLDKWLRAG